MFWNLQTLFIPLLKQFDMLPVDFEGSNITFTKPKGWADEECFDLKAMKGIDDKGSPFILTRWMPSKEDLEAMNTGLGFWVKTYSHSFLPMEILTVNENNKVN